MASVDEEAGNLRWPNDRGPIRRHRAQARPEAGPRHVTAREEIGDGMLERQATRFAQIVGVSGDFRHASDTDPVAKTRDSNLVGLVHHGGEGRVPVVGDRDG